MTRTDARLDYTVREVLHLATTQSAKAASLTVRAKLTDLIEAEREDWAAHTIVLPDDKHLEWVRQQAMCAERMADE